MDIQARPMTRPERKAFQAAGLDARRNASKLQQWKEQQKFEDVIIFNDEAEDWILDHIYGDELPADIPNNEASKLAIDTYNLTFGLAEDEKNSSASTVGSPTVDQNIAETAQK
jgi:hypothetical protein